MVTESNPYAAPHASLQGPEPTDEELTAFVGENARYYLRKWARLRSGAGRSGGFNWVAAFFPVPWLAYRKLYVYIVPAWLGPPVLGVVFGLIVSTSELQGGMILIVGGAMFTALYVAYALAGNLILYRRARQILAEANGDLPTITRRGGVSEIAMWLALVGTVSIQGGLALLRAIAQAE